MNKEERIKRTPLRRIGRRGKINIEANKKLREIYADKGITRCEVGLEGCSGGLFCAFAHRHRRVFYKNRPELLSSFNQTIWSCSNCHSKIDSDKKLSEEVFQNLRGYERE